MSHLQSLKFRRPLSFAPMDPNAAFAGQNPPLTPAQLESLQRMVKQFKDLLKRYSESRVQKLVEATAATSSAANASQATTQVSSVSESLIAKSTPNAPEQSSNGAANTLPSTNGAYATGNYATDNRNLKQNRPFYPTPTLNTKVEAKDVPSGGMVQSYQPIPISNALFPPPVSTSSSLSWQCFHSLLFYGLGKSPNDGSVAFSLSVSVQT